MRNFLPAFTIIGIMIMSSVAESVDMGGLSVTLDENQKTLTISPGSAPPGSTISAEDSADGVEVTSTEFIVGDTHNATLILRGTSLDITPGDDAEPTVTVGGRNQSVGDTFDTPEKVTVNLKGPINAGDNKFKLKNSQGFSEGFVTLGGLTEEAPDDVPPVLVLTPGPDGNIEVILQLNEAYVEFGATATDDVDGAISANNIMRKLDAGGPIPLGDPLSIDSAVAGNHVIEYSVSDAADNPAIPQTRTVAVTGGTPPHCRQRCKHHAAGSCRRERHYLRRLYFDPKNHNFCEQCYPVSCTKQVWWQECLLQWIRGFSQGHLKRL